MKKLSMGLAFVLALGSVSNGAEKMAPVVSSSAGIYKHRFDPQKVTVVNNGLAALKLRLDMIENAKQSIEMEYFIYSIDTAGRLITQALIRKAKQGVKVRVIVDTSLPIFELNRYYAAVLKEAGIQVHYYNEAWLIQIVSTQFRSHRKSLIVDGQKAITGGRNIADEYFDLSSEYNFMDTDMYVEGSIVRDMLASFEEFWTADITKPAPEVKEPQPEEYYGLSKDNLDDWFVQQDEETKRSLDRYHSDLYFYNKGMNKARVFTVTTDEDLRTLEKVHNEGAQFLAKETTDYCNDMTYAADFPGMGEKTRVLRKQLAKEAVMARHEVDIESPYFVIKKEISDVLQRLLNRKVKINVLTNSLYSTDAFYTQAAFDTRISVWTKAGVNVWMHSGERDPKTYPVTEVAEGARWGTHSKRAVIDGKTSIVGTFNMDPRSTNLNAEMALICRDNEVIAHSIQQDMRNRINYGIKLGLNGRTEDGQVVRKQSPFSKKVLFWLSMPLANLFDFLL